MISETQNWRMDRQISLGVLIAIVLQTAGALMWTGEAGARLKHLEAQVLIKMTSRSVWPG